MVSLQPYKKYIDVVYDYVNTLPDSWQLLPNIAIFQERKERGTENEETLSISAIRGVVKSSDYENRKDRTSDDKSQYLLVKEGDLAYNTMLMWDGAVGHSSFRGIVSPAYTVLKAKMKINPKFFHYQLRTEFYKNYSRRFSYGIVDARLRLYYVHFKRMYSIVPPLDVQNGIAVYLDKKNNEIEKFIRNKEKLIELLEEEKNNVVFNIISNGTHKHKSFKESGINWIGKIPTGWQVRRFSWEVIIQEGPGIMAVDFRNEGIPLMRISGLKGDLANLDGCNYLDPKKVKIKWNHFRLNKGDILISASASTDIVCEVSDEAEGSIPYTGIIRLLPRAKGKRLNKEFLKLYISSKIYNHQVELLKEGSTIQHYGPTHLKGFFLFLPSLEEQEEMVTKSKKEISVLNLAISKAHKEIASIKEYQEAIITDLVTGKHSAPQLQVS